MDNGDFTVRKLSNDQRVYSTFHHISVSLVKLGLRSPRSMASPPGNLLQNADGADDWRKEKRVDASRGDGGHERALAHGQPNIISHFIFMLDILFSPYFLFYKKSRIVLWYYDVLCSWLWRQSFFLAKNNDDLCEISSQSCGHDASWATRWALWDSGTSMGWDVKLAVYVGIMARGYLMGYYISCFSWIVQKLGPTKKIRAV